MQRRLPCRATVRHNDPGVTGGPRLYLRATVEINETKTGTRSGMRCVSCREVGPSTTVSDFTYARQDAEAVPMTSPANRVASFTLVVKRILSCPRVVSHGSELKRKRREGL